ncbi:hypothetical protein [Hymenobacter psoromatis]|uniref:hypothetical protein n=1 Tax=Hymenobacter psoromatis TaxID=1484116 RepID=UPI001CBC5C1A|nr:hypothetical protein [Hymenobacter psoromatis]
MKKLQGAAKPAEIAGNTRKAIGKRDPAAHSVRPSSLYCGELKKGLLAGVSKAPRPRKQSESQPERWVFKAKL